MDSSVKIEAILFWKGEPVCRAALADMAGLSPEEVESGLKELEKSLENRGVQLIYNADEVLLGTASSVGPLIEKLVKEELIRDLGKAGLETLAIVLYRGPVSRKDMDYIRGVNSSYIVRNLLVRGLIEKTEQKGARGTAYQPTTALLSYLGVGKISDLPEYQAVQEEIEKQKEHE